MDGPSPSVAPCGACPVIRALPGARGHREEGSGLPQGLREARWRGSGVEGPQAAERRRAHEVPRDARRIVRGDGGRRRGTGLGRAVPRARSAVRRGPRADGGARRQCQVLRRRNGSDAAVPRRVAAAMRLLDLRARGGRRARAAAATGIRQAQRCATAALEIACQC